MDGSRPAGRNTNYTYSTMTAHARRDLILQHTQNVVNSEPVVQSCDMLTYLVYQTDQENITTKPSWPKSWVKARGKKKKTTFSTF